MFTPHFFSVGFRSFDGTLASAYSAFFSASFAALAFILSIFFAAILLPLPNENGSATTIPATNDMIIVINTGTR